MLGTAKAAFQPWAGDFQGVATLNRVVQIQLLRNRAGHLGKSGGVDAARRIHSHLQATAAPGNIKHLCAEIGNQRLDERLDFVFYSCCTHWRAFWLGCRVLGGGLSGVCFWAATQHKKGAGTCPRLPHP